MRLVLTCLSDFTFSCPTCGQHIACDSSNAGMSIACPACKTVLTVPAAPAATPPAHAGLSIAASQARHTASEAAHSAAIMSRSYAQPAATNSGPPKTSGLAIASLVCSLTTCPGFIPGIICGHLARRAFKRDPSLKGGGMATAGLIIGYFTLAFTVGFLVLSAAGFVSAFKKGYVQASSQYSNSLSGSVKVSTNSKPPGDSLWTLNLTAADFPDHPAAGKIHGLDFTIETAKAQSGVIALRQGQSAIADRQISLFYFPKAGETLAGKKYDISPANADLFQGVMPHIHMSWRDDDQTKNKPTVFKSGYALKLEFGQADADGRIPGKIYLCLPDDEKSFVAGTFELQEKKPVDKPKKNKTPGTN